MPYRVINIEEAASYLHLKREDVELLVKDGKIPFQKRGGRVVFNVHEIEGWASQRILGFESRGLTDFHQQSGHGTREILPNEAIMPELMHSRFIDASMAAKTRASVIRSMVNLAEGTGRVNDQRDLLNSLEAREELCSTAVPGGLALLHPRHHQPYMFESSFIVLGRTHQEIHFGSPDGQPSDLFFLICCQDDRIHLHTLARVCMVALKTELLTQLRQASDADEMFQSIIEAEEEVLKSKSSSN